MELECTAKISDQRRCTDRGTCHQRFHICTERIDSLVLYVITVVIVQVRDVMALIKIEHVICDEQANYSAQKKYEQLASDASFDCR